MSPPRSCDVAIVGGGLVGNALGYELACMGVDALLIDQEDGGRATDAGAGVLSPETSQNADEGWFAFAKAAAAHNRRLVDRLGGDGADDTGFRECGVLTVSVREDEDSWFDDAVSLMLRRSPGEVHEIAPDEATLRYPPLREVPRALYSPLGARVDGRQLNAALAGAARKRGLERIGEGIRAIETSNSRCVAVQTGVERVPCGAVVVAAGAWSAAICRQLAVELPVYPMKGQIVHVRLRGAESGNWPILQPILTYYQVPWPAGRIACGGTMEAAAGFNIAVTAAAVHELLREALLVAPGLAPAELVEVRVGLRPASRDGHPFLGQLPGWDNVFVATGHGTEGLLLGPYSAALVAETLVGASASPQLDLFAAARIAD